MKVKLFDLARELEVGVATLNDFLVAKKVIEAPSNNPNARIDVKEYKMIMGEFGSNLSASRKEEIEKKLFPAPKTAKSKQPVQKEPVTEEANEKKEVATKPSGLQVKGHIDLAKPASSQKQAITTSKKTLEGKESLPKQEATKRTDEKGDALNGEKPKEFDTPSATVVPKTIRKAEEPLVEAKKESLKETIITDVKKTPEATEKNTIKSEVETAEETKPTTQVKKESPLTPPKKEDTHKPDTKEKVMTSSEKENKTSHTPTAKANEEDNKAVTKHEQPHEDKREKTSPQPAIAPQATLAPQEVVKPSIATPTPQPKPESKPQGTKTAPQEGSHKPTTPIKKEQEDSKPTEDNQQTPSKKEPEVFRIELADAPKFEVKGKIDLSAIEPSRGKKGKRTTRRKRISTNAVDIKAEASKGVNQNKATRREEGEDRNKNNKGASNRGANTSSQQLGRKAKRNAKKANTTQHQEVSSEDIERKVKEVQARIAAGKRQSFGRTDTRRRRDMAKRQAERDAQSQLEEAKVIKITEYVTVSDLANLMGVPVNEVIATCMSIDMMVSINMRLDSDTISLIAEEFGFKTEFVSADVVEAIAETKEEDDEKDLVERPPVVTVMGHVDHGKTSLLDHIRNTNVIAGEAGGITQHIGAYSVTLKNGRCVTFLDTPGHQAFTAMRARGAKATDIAIIIVDATSQVMPQTKEALNHASAAGVPIVFAINKIDKPTANPNQIKEQLAQLNYLVEDWGGKYQCQEISAKKGDGVRELLDKVLLEADLLELKANPKREASGLIIESSLDKGRGYVAQILVSNGTLHVGDMVLAGKYCGRVRALTNERGQKMEVAPPSTPATLLGLDGAPAAGDTFNVLENEQEAKNIAHRRRQLDREQDIRTQHRLTLDQIGQRIKIGNFKELNLIIKGDVDGSIEALSDSLIKLSTPEIEVKVIHKAVGQISENDVDLARASEAVIIGFQVRPNSTARKLAEQYGVEIRTYSIIYDAIDDVKSAMEGMLAPEIREQVTATLEVLQVFNIKGIGTIAGCMVKEGKIKRTDKVRVIREGIVVHTGELASLKRYKDDAKEVATGLECGLSVKNYDDLQEGDTLESFMEIEMKKKL